MRLTIHSVLTAAVAGAALTACSPAAEPPRVPASGPAPMLAGVDLGQPVRVGGNEPFWAVEITATELIYSGPDRPEQRAPRPEPRVQGTVATYQATTSTGGSMTVTLTATTCSDGMSDREYPLSAIVRIGEETLTGCAAASAAFATAGESGPVV